MSITFSCRHERTVNSFHVSENITSDTYSEEGFESQADEWIDSVMQGLTLEERVGQCFMPVIPSIDNSYNHNLLKRYISDYHVGGIVLLEGDLKSALSLIEQCSHSQIPMIFAIDAEWGLGMRLEDALSYPKNGDLPSTADDILLFDYGREVARQCRKAGINMVLGPVVDVVENPKGAIGKRSFGSDSRRVTDLGLAYATGLEQGGVLSVAKHFPGHGSPIKDSHKSLPVIERDRTLLDSIDLRPFKKYVEASLSGIMVGHLAVPALDSTNVPAAMSKPIIEGLLKKEWGFRGLVLTDALNMAGASGYNAVDALEAGADIIIGPAEVGTEIDKVISALHTGELSMEELDKRCSKILFYKYLFCITGEKSSANINPEDFKDNKAKELEQRLTEQNIMHQSFPESR